MPAWLLPGILAGSALLGSKNKPKSVPTSSTTTAQVPPWLQPFYSQAGGVGVDALRGLSGVTEDIVSGMPASAGDLNAQAVQSVLDFAGGGDPRRNLAMQELLKAGGGQNVKDLSAQFLGLAGTPQAEIKPQRINKTVEQTLQSLMQGNFIGSPGFQANVDASIRAAQPYIYSGFGKAGGVGATKGGLAQVAMQQAASDAFARLYGDERGRQLGAANSYVSAEAQRAQAAAMRAQAAAAREANRINERGLLANMALQERQNQFGALGALSGAGLQDAAALQGVSGIPQDAYTTLLGSSIGLIPGNVVGQTTNATQPVYRNRGAGLLGGALAGAELGGAGLADWLTPGVGAGIGGVLGAFF